MTQEITPGCYLSFLELYNGVYRPLYNLFQDFKNGPLSRIVDDYNTTKDSLSKLSSATLNSVKPIVPNLTILQKNVSQYRKQLEANVSQTKSSLIFELFFFIYFPWWLMMFLFLVLLWFQKVISNKSFFLFLIGMLIIPIIVYFISGAVLYNTLTKIIPSLNNIELAIDNVQNNIRFLYDTITGDELTSLILSFGNLENKIKETKESLENAFPVLQQTIEINVSKAGQDIATNCFR